ncbi:FAD:protein FMN transferase [Skermanella aerolata]|uniref:FAD:protein FMN transferase n=1 Tax=Skermanella aerolata TaxID=393310 RepID=UPI003D250CE5
MRPPAYQQGCCSRDVQVANPIWRSPPICLKCNISLLNPHITDHVAGRLRAEDMTDVLVDMGEVLALGRHPGGRPWRMEVQNGDERRKNEAIDGIDIAVATSSSRATVFDPAGRFGHIFDPFTGACETRPVSVTVTAPDATTADTVSTAHAAMPCRLASTMAISLPGLGVRITLADEPSRSCG